MSLGLGCSSVHRGLGSHTKSCVRFPVLYKLGKGRHTVNPSTQEAASRSLGSSQLHRKFEVNLGYMVSGYKQTQTNQHHVTSEHTILRLGRRRRERCHWVNDFVQPDTWPYKAEGDVCVLETSFSILTFIALSSCPPRERGGLVSEPPQCASWSRNFKDAF